MKLGRFKAGRNDRKHNHNRYGAKVVTDNNCTVLPSGAIEPKSEKVV